MLSQEDVFGLSFLDDETDDMVGNQAVKRSFVLKKRYFIEIQLPIVVKMMVICLMTLLVIVHFNFAYRQSNLIQKSEISFEDANFYGLDQNEVVEKSNAETFPTSFEALKCFVCTLAFGSLLIISSSTFNSQ